MLRPKQEVFNFQESGVEGWLCCRADQRSDTKFDACGEPVIFIGYPSNQQGFLVWCPGSGPTKILLPRTFCSELDVLDSFGRLLNNLTNSIPRYRCQELQLFILCRR